MEPADATTIPLSKVRGVRLTDAVADQLRDLILSGELGEGDRLPPLDRLVKQFGVSAPTMREALRTLEAEGLVVVQRGGIGGALVRRPTPTAAAYTLALVLRSQATEKHDVAEAIAMFEPLCAASCARRDDRRTAVTPELRPLNEAARELVDGSARAFNDRMLEFHRAIVRLSGNATLTLVTRALEDLWLADVRAWVAVNEPEGRYPDAEGRQRQVAVHDQIVELIDDGDHRAVTDLMTEHIHEEVFRSVADSHELVDPKAVRASY